jgi:hypothetical protein
MKSEVSRASATAATWRQIGRGDLTRRCSSGTSEIYFGFDSAEIKDGLASHLEKRAPSFPRKSPF